MRLNNTALATLIFLAALSGCRLIAPTPPAPIAETPGGISSPPSPTTPLATEAGATPAPADIPAAVTPETVAVTVFFTDTKRYAAGIPPFEAAVTRQVAAGAYLPEAVLEEFFGGTSEQEQALGLELIDSGFTGYKQLVVADGTAHVYLSGPCQSGGATYTIAQPLLANLGQFPEIRYVKIYDAEGSTGEPSGESNSIPACLEP